MSKYKAGDKVVVEIENVYESAFGDYCYILKGIGSYGADWTNKKTEPLTNYTEPLEAKNRRQAAEITRLQRDNKELKEESKRNYTINIEMARAEGHSEAWELARKIASTAGGLSSSELIEIFNSFLPRDILSENTYPEAAAKVEAWEKAKEEIKVGDIVMYESGMNVCVIKVHPSGTLRFIDTTLEVYDHIKPEKCVKTGRHIDIDSFLKQIGEE